MIRPENSCFPNEPKYIHKEGCGLALFFIFVSMSFLIIITIMNNWTSTSPTIFCHKHFLVVSRFPLRKGTKTKKRNVINNNGWLVTLVITSSVKKAEQSFKGEFVYLSCNIFSLFTSLTRVCILVSTQFHFEQIIIESCRTYFFILGKSHMNYYAFERKVTTRHSFPCYIELWCRCRFSLNAFLQVSLIMRKGEKGRSTRKDTSFRICLICYRNRDIIVLKWQRKK